VRLKRLVLPGRFVEAYLYFDFLWLVSRDGVVRAFDIEAFCNGNLGGDAEAAVVLFADNQRFLREKRRLSELFVRVTNLLNANSVIEASVSDTDQYSYIFSTDIRFRSVLDLRFYYGRGYIGTDSSIRQFVARGRDEMGADQPGRIAGQGLKDELVSDRPARQFRCRYGAVGAACGRAGGVVGTGAGTDDPAWRISFEQFANESFGIELSGDAIANVSRTNEIEFFFAARRPSRHIASNAARDDQMERLELVDVQGQGFEEQTSRLNSLVSSYGSESRVFLFQSTVWVITSAGELRRLKIVEEERLLPSPIERGRFLAPPERVISTSSTAEGIIAETDEHVFILNDRRWKEVFNEPVHSVRGYPSSRRYQNLVTAVARDRVELIALVK
jgi:hypothetical protein